MRIYDRLFVNHYNYYGKIFSPSRVASVYYLTSIQLVHVLAIVAPFVYFIKLEHNRDRAIIIVFSLSLGIFNAIYYDQKKMGKLFAEYEEFSEHQKSRSRFISVSI